MKDIALLKLNWLEARDKYYQHPCASESTTIEQDAEEMRLLKLANAAKDAYNAALREHKGL